MPSSPPPYSQSIAHGDADLSPENHIQEAIARVNALTVESNDIDARFHHIDKLLSLSDINEHERHQFAEYRKVISQRQLDVDYLLIMYRRNTLTSCGTPEPSLVKLRLLLRVRFSCSFI
jgi:hypothetical protein